MQTATFYEKHAFRQGDGLYEVVDVKGKRREKPDDAN